MDGGVDLGGTDRHDPGTLLALDLEAGAVEHRLGGAVEVVQQRVEGGVELVGDLTGQCLAADRDPLQAAPFADTGQRQKEPQQGWHEVHGGDALVAQQGGEVADVAEPAGLRDDQARTGGEHAEDLADRYVESLGGDLQQAVVLGHLVFGAEPGKVFGDGAVRHRHALGQAGGSRGVDQVGGVLGQQRPHPVGIGRVVRAVALHAGDRFADHDFRIRVGQDVGQPVIGVGGVDRQIHRACLDDAQRGDDQFR